MILERVEAFQEVHAAEWLLFVRRHHSEHKLHIFFEFRNPKFDSKLSYFLNASQTQTCFTNTESLDIK